MKDGSIITAAILGIAGLIVLALFSPVITIWALNLLFHTGIELTLGTYFAVLWLSGLVAARISRSS
jgi:antibiotic biosynthesis monooxygenase (ABM) superfamily enzyme